MFHNKEYVYEVYKTRSFSKAAEQLHISQPALSASIHKIEEKVGAPIFERTTRPLSLTPFGVEYIQAIEKVFEIEECLHNISSTMNSVPSGTVTVSGSNLGINYLIPKRFTIFQKQYPEVTLRILEATTTRSKAMLDDGISDLMITNRPMDPQDYEKLVCYKEFLLVAVPKSYPINRQLVSKRLTIDELKNGFLPSCHQKEVPLTAFRLEPFVLLMRENYLRTCCENMFSEADMIPHVALEVEKQSVALNFSNMGSGVTIVSDQLARSSINQDGLYFYKIQSAYAIRNTYVCYRRGRFITKAMQKLLETLTLSQSNDSQA